MAERQLVQALYNFDINTAGGLRKVFPQAAAGVAVTSGAHVFGSWTQIVAAGVLDNPTYIVGVIPSSPTTPTADEEYRIDLAVGASGSEVSLSSNSNTAKGLSGLGLSFVSSVGIFALTELDFGKVIFKISGSPRLSAAVSEFLVGSTSISLAVVTWTPSTAV